MAIDAAGDVLAFELWQELPQIDPDQIRRQAIDRSLVSRMLRAAAMDFRFVVAGEKPIPGKRIGREVFFEESAGIAGGLHAGHQPLASGSCVRIDRKSVV